MAHSRIPNGGLLYAQGRLATPERRRARGDSAEGQALSSQQLGEVSSRAHLTAKAIRELSRKQSGHGRRPGAKYRP